MDSPINNFNMPSWHDTGDDDEPAGPPHSSNAVASTSRYPYEATGAWVGAPAGVHSEGSFGPAFARGAGGTASLDTEDCDGAGSFGAGKAPGGQTPGVSQFRISVGAPTSPHPPTVVSAAAGGHRATITPLTINPYALPPVHSFLPLLRDGHSPSFDPHAQSPVRSPAVVASRGTTSSSSEDGHRDVRSSNPAALVSTTLWEDEATVCFQVLVQGHTVARRADNNEINCTKLLNVTGMTRGRRDGLLKGEKLRNIVKRGSLQLKGVWLSFPRALVLARANGLEEELYPLFEDDIESYLYQPANRSRTAALLLASAEFRSTPLAPRAPAGDSPASDKAARVVAVHNFLDRMEQKLSESSDGHDDDNALVYGSEIPAAPFNRLVAPRSSARRSGKTLVPLMARRTSSESLDRPLSSDPHSALHSPTSPSNTPTSFTFGATAGSSRGSNWIDLGGEQTEEEANELKDIAHPMGYGGLPPRHPGFHLATDARRHSYPSLVPTLHQTREQYALHPTLGGRAMSIDSAAVARMQAQAQQAGKQYDPPEGPPPGYFQQYESTSTSFPFPSSSSSYPHAPIPSPSLDFESSLNSGSFGYYAGRGTPSYMPTQTPLPPMYQPLNSPNPQGAPRANYSAYPSGLIPSPSIQPSQHYPFAQLRQAHPNAFQPLSTQQYYSPPSNTGTLSPGGYAQSYSNYSGEQTTSPRPAPGALRRLLTPGDRRDSLIGVLGPLELKPVLTKRGGSEDGDHGGVRDFGDEIERKRMRYDEESPRRASVF